MTIGVTAKIQILAGKNDEFEAIFKQLVSAVHANEKGCLLYAFYQSREDAQTYIVLEQYTDDSAFHAHTKTEHYKHFGQAVSSCFAAAPKIELMDSIE